jgi:hypothetical protein
MKITDFQEFNNFNLELKIKNDNLIKRNSEFVGLIQGVIFDKSGQQANTDYQISFNSMIYVDKLSYISLLQFYGQADTRLHADIGDVLSFNNYVFEVVYITETFKNYDIEPYYRLFCHKQRT